jgi:hypothetical protein
MQVSPPRGHFVVKQLGGMWILHRDCIRLDVWIELTLRLKQPASGSVALVLGLLLEGEIFIDRVLPLFALIYRSVVRHCAGTKQPNLLCIRDVWRSSSCAERLNDLVVDFSEIKPCRHLLVGIKEWGSPGPASRPNFFRNASICWCAISTSGGGIGKVRDFVGLLRCFAPRLFGMAYTSLVDQKPDIARLGRQVRDRPP